MSKDFARRPREEICFEINPGEWTKEWKIQSFMGFLNRAEKDRSHMIWSNPFFLGEKGYKVKLGVGFYRCISSYLKIEDNVDRNGP